MNCHFWVNYPWMVFKECKYCLTTVCAFFILFLWLCFYRSAIKTAVKNVLCPMVLTAATAPAAMALAWWDASNPPQYIITFSRLYSADWFLVSLFSSVSFTREDTAADMQWMIVTYQRLVQETQDRSRFFPTSITVMFKWPHWAQIWQLFFLQNGQWSVDLVKIYQTLWCLFVKNYRLRLLHISVQHLEMLDTCHNPNDALESTDRNVTVAKWQ